MAPRSTSSGWAGQEGRKLLLGVAVVLVLLLNMELQGWNTVAAASTVLRKQQKSERGPIAEVMPPRVAVVLGPSEGEERAMEVNDVAGTLRVPSGPKGGFRFDYVAPSSHAERLFENEVAPVVDAFINEKRSSSIVLIGGEAARVREMLGAFGSNGDVPMPIMDGSTHGVLSRMLMRLVDSQRAGASELAWDLVIMVGWPEAAGTRVDTRLGTPTGSPLGLAINSPRMRPIVVRLEKPRDVATACSVIDRQLAGAWGDGEAAAGGQLMCSIRRRVNVGDAPASPLSQSPRSSAVPLIAYKQMVPPVDGSAQLSLVVFGSVEVSLRF